MNCVSLVIFLFVEQIKTTYLGKLDAERAFTQASYHNIKSHFTSIEHIKNKPENQNFNTRVKLRYLPFKLLR